MPGDQWAKVSLDGKTYKWNNWGDIVSVKDKSTIWATYSDQFYKGNAAVINRKLGKGTVTYIGVDTDNGELEKVVLSKIYDKIGETYNLPEGILIEWRDGFFVGLNYTSASYDFPISDVSKIIVGQQTTAPAEVVIWK